MLGQKRVNNILKLICSLVFCCLFFVIFLVGWCLDMYRDVVGYIQLERKILCVLPAYGKSKGNVVIKNGSKLILIGFGLFLNMFRFIWSLIKVIVIVIFDILIYFGKIELFNLRALYLGWFKNLKEKSKKWSNRGKKAINNRKRNVLILAILLKLWFWFIMLSCGIVLCEIAG